ncbi:MAG: T9SS type A sorting domain-containing protein [Flavobacteriales bacterium]|nr:T9SS type A sorting domain-containing protein [Flavobacteriales bacterium]MBK6944563.1 T9SS type A sorting domain-containing protein [Flavobacteriales bacterium]MBK7241287.1 T9SS type A sorting domain-containing protein [Flavobacteriales bacterium]MBK7295544.1 T9SS type A sorting domain-containing protein [Flavobacteriales bacterium]MBK9534218.1 T9SS type A sorting domain-containing protein [Flavobacteriales bacterium]
MSVQQINSIVCSMVLVLCGNATIRAQEHPFIAHNELTELTGGIRVDWTIQGGSTCNGQAVERSADGINFTEVHHIEGICGDPTNAVAYQWFDESPPELSTVFYRIQLGFEGYSSVRSVEYEQIESSDQRFYPSPMNDVATLLLKVPFGTVVDLTIWNSSGQLVHQQTTNGGKVDLVLPGLLAGVYTYQASGDSKVFKGRFVKF